MECPLRWNYFSHAVGRAAFVQKSRTCPLTARRTKCQCNRRCNEKVIFVLGGKMYIFGGYDLLGPGAAIIEKEKQVNPLKLARPND